MPTPASRGRCGPESGYLSRTVTGTRLCDGTEAGPSSKEANMELTSSRSTDPAEYPSARASTSSRSASSTTPQAEDQRRGRVTKVAPTRMPHLPTRPSSEDRRATVGAGTTPTQSSRPPAQMSHRPRLRPTRGSSRKPSILYRPGGSLSSLGAWEPIPPRLLHRMSERQIQHHLNRLKRRIARLQLLDRTCRRRLPSGQDPNDILTPVQRNRRRQARRPRQARLQQRHLPERRRQEDRSG